MAVFLLVKPGGERGIRTLGTFYRTPVFKTGTFNHSVISPWSLNHGSRLVVSSRGLAGYDGDPDLVRTGSPQRLRRIPQSGAGSHDIV